MSCRHVSRELQCLTVIPCYIFHFASGADSSYCFLLKARQVVRLLVIWDHLQHILRLAAESFQRITLSLPISEEAVSEVRRAAVAEVQRAVGAAEARAQELVAAERAKVEALLREVGRRDPSEPRTEPQQVGFAPLAGFPFTTRWKFLCLGF